MEHRPTIRKATSHSIQTEQVLEIFGLKGRQVARMTLDFKPNNLVILTAECEVSEDELAALVEQLHGDPPVQRDVLSISRIT